MALIGFVLTLGAGVALGLDEGTWFLWLFIGGLAAQFAGLSQRFERWRRKE